MNIQPIGIIHTPFMASDGTPIQPSVAKGAEGTVQVFDDYAKGLMDIEGFDRIWLLFWFDRSSEAKLTVIPYKDDRKHGLFATRAPCRPNPIGLSSVRLLGVEGTILHVAGVDMLDGTPLLDIKPYVPSFDVYDTVRCGWLDTASDTTKADSRFEKLPHRNTGNDT